MSKASNREYTKTRSGTPIVVKLPSDALSRLDDWRRTQIDPPGRAEAMRRLVEIGMKKPSRRAIEREALAMQSAAKFRAIAEANKAAYDAKIERLRQERLATLASEPEGSRKSRRGIPRSTTSPSSVSK
jgi:hypothetical protein